MKKEVNNVKSLLQAAAIFGLLLVGLLGSVRAQTTIWSHTTAGVFIDHLAAIPGDLDGDGINDIAYYDSSNNLYTILSATTGTTIVTVTMPPGDLPIFGLRAPNNRRFLPVGDVDGDGNQDVWLRTQAGSRIVDALSGQLIWSMPAIVGVVELFHPVALGDIDFDGCDDILFRVQSTNGDDSFWAYSINLDSQIYALPPLTPILAPISDLGDRGAVRIGDLDGDGLSEFAIADLFIANMGNVTVFSAATGAPLTVLNAPTGVVRLSNGYGTYGCSIAAVGDHDGDQIPDIGVFEATVLNTLGGRGEFRIHSLPSGQLISQYEWTSNLTLLVNISGVVPPFSGPYGCISSYGFFEGVGDINRDGIGDFYADRTFIPSTTFSSAFGRLISGETGNNMRLLVDFAGVGIQDVWVGLVSAVDTTGDSLKEVLLVEYDYPDFVSPGSPAELRLIDPTVRGTSSFGEACNLNPASSQVPRIGLDVDRVLGAVVGNCPVNPIFLSR
ncbi:MAG: VCBS repeat-containing protein [Planctomycetota bacterium]